MEMIDESSPTMSSIEFFVYVDEMTGLLWINIPSSDDEPWRVYEVPCFGRRSLSVSHVITTRSLFLRDNSVSSRTVRMAPFPRHHIPNPLSSLTCVIFSLYSNTPSKRNRFTRFDCNPPGYIPLSRTLTANSNPALPIPRIPLVKPRNTPTPRREAPGSALWTTG